jgi:hypothetical protein
MMVVALSWGSGDAHLDAANRNAAATSSAAFGGRADRSDDVAPVAVGLLATVGEDLIRNLAAVDFNRAWEVEGDPDAVALDRHDANDTDRRRGVSDDDFFTFASCDDKHWGTSCPSLSTCLPLG